MFIFKIIGVALIVFGLIFRAISTAYFNTHAKYVPNTPKAQKRFAAKRRNAFLIDVAFIIAGIMTILGH